MKYTAQDILNAKEYIIKNFDLVTLLVDDAIDCSRSGTSEYFRVFAVNNDGFIKNITETASKLVNDYRYSEMKDAIEVRGGGFNKNGALWIDIENALKAKCVNNELI